MRLRREKNLKKLTEAIESAEFWRNGMLNLLNEQSEVQGALKKAEHRQEYRDVSKLYFKDLKEVKKRARLLGYSEKEINAIVDEIYWPDGRPQVRVPQS